MHKNIKTAMLVILLIIIWGIIAYRIYEHTKTPSVDIETDLSFKYPTANTTESREYILELNYRDPFLPGKMIVEEKVEKTILKKKYVRWPKLKYKGCIYRKNRQLGILDLDGKLEFVRKGQEFQNIEIGKIYKDSIQLIYKKNMRTFKMQS